MRHRGCKVNTLKKTLYLRSALALFMIAVLGVARCIVGVSPFFELRVAEAAALAPTLVQSALSAPTCPSPTATSLQKTFAANTIAADAIIVGLYIGGTNKSPALTDSQGTIFTQAANINQTTDGHQIFLYYGKNIKGGPDTITASWSGSTPCNALQIFEFSGLDLASPFDQGIRATGSGTVASTGSAATTTQASELLFGFFGESGAGTAVTAGSGYTKGILAQIGGLNNSFSEFRNVSSVGSFAATSTSNASENWNGILAAFKAASTATPPTISSFTANPGSITAGTASTLSWSTTGATSLSIAPVNYSTASSSGSLVVNPSSSTTYVLTAESPAGSSTAQSTVTVVPDTTPPSVPTNLAVTGTTTSTVSLSWSASADNVGVAGYRVFRNGTLIATTTVTSCTDAGLNQSTTYSYTVAAFDAAGNVSSQSCA